MRTFFLRSLVKVHVKPVFFIGKSTGADSHTITQVLTMEQLTKILNILMLLFFAFINMYHSLSYYKNTFIGFGDMKTKIKICYGNIQLFTSFPQ